MAVSEFMLLRVMRALRIDAAPCDVRAVIRNVQVMFRQPASAGAGGWWCRWVVVLAGGCRCRCRWVAVPVPVGGGAGGWWCWRVLASLTFANLICFMWPLVCTPCGLRSAQHVP